MINASKPSDLSSIKGGDFSKKIIIQHHFNWKVISFTPSRNVYDSRKCLHGNYTNSSLHAVLNNSTGLYTHLKDY